MTKFEERAKIFATAAHYAAGNVRKYTGEPYINHPAEVASILDLCAEPPTEQMKCAAWLHDVVEDTGVPISVIDDIFGHYVASLVEQLTDVSKPEDGNRAARKEIDRNHTAKCCPSAATIKLADLISNTKSIVARDAEFAKTYLAEKKLLLEVLKHGDENLWKVAYEIAYGC